MKIQNLKDYFGKEIKFDDWLVTLHDFKTKQYLTNKSLVFKIIVDEGKVVSLEPNSTLTVPEYNVGELYDLVHGDMAVIVEKF